MEKANFNGPKHWCVALCAFVLQMLFICSAHSQIFVANRSGSIGEYDFDGSPINTSLISGLNVPVALTISGGNLFVVNSGTIGEYTLDGSMVTGAFAGLTNAGAITVSGSSLFIAHGSTIGEYNLDGTPVHASLVSGVGSVSGLAVSGTNLFVAVGGIREYALSGSSATLLAASLPNGPSDGAEQFAVSGSTYFTPGWGIAGSLSAYAVSGTTASRVWSVLVQDSTAVAISGTNLFVVDADDSVVREYTTSGDVVNAALISGLDLPWGIAIAEPVPEPSTCVMLALAGAGLLFGRRRFASRSQR